MSGEGRTKLQDVLNEFIHKSSWALGQRDSSGEKHPQIGTGDTTDNREKKVDRKLRRLQGNLLFCEPVHRVSHLEMTLSLAGSLKKN